MAEFVEKKLEEMIPEIEELERTGLLNEDEVRQLIIKRRHYLYKMGARNPCKSDYINAINYEGQLLELLSIRRKIMRMFEKFEQIEQVLIQRQEQVLRVVSRRYTDDFNIWDMRINFAKGVGHVHEVRKAYKEMSLKHSDKLSLWVQWAQFEMTARKDFQKAREILLSEASLHHPNSKVLRRELFRFELLYLEYLFKGRLSNDMTNEGSVVALTDAQKTVFNLGAARLVYRKSVQEHPDPDMALQLYNIAYTFPFSRDLREEIYNDVVTGFSMTPEVAILRAERAALGLPAGDDQQLLQDTEEEHSHSAGESDGEQDGDEESDGEQDGDEESDGEQDDGESDGQLEDNSEQEDDMNDDGDSNQMNSEEEKDEKSSEKDNDAKPNDVKDPKNEEVQEEDYLIPYSIYTATKKELKNQVEALPVTSQDRRVMMSTYLLTLGRGFAALVKSSTELDSNVFSLYSDHLTALLYHCWGCSSSITLIAQHYSDSCTRHKKHLQPQHLLIWAAILDQFPSLSSPWSSYAVLQEAVSLHPSHEPTMVYVLQRMAEEHCTDNEAIIKEYMRICGKLSSSWHSIAHKLVTTHLTKGPARSQFLEQQCKWSTNNDVAKNTRLARLWSEYQDSNIEAARAVYHKYHFMPPFCDELHSTMCMLELYGPQDQQSSAENTPDTEQRTASSSSDVQITIDTTGDRQEHDQDHHHDDDAGQEEEQTHHIMMRYMTHEDDDNEESDVNNEEDNEDDDNEDDDNEDDDNDESDNNINSDGESSGYDEGSEEDDDEESKDELKFELCRRPDNERVRQIFKMAIRQSNGKHHDVWLAYTQFELRFGSAVEAGKLMKQGEQSMEAWSVQAFRDMMMDIRDQRFQLGSVDGEEDASSEVAESEPELPALLSCLPRYYSQLKKIKQANRKTFFKRLTYINAQLNDKPKCPEGLGMTWQDVLTLLLDGQRVRPRVLHAVKGTPTTADQTIKQQLSQYKQEQTARVFVPGEKLYRNKYVQYKGSDTLRVADNEETAKRRPALKKSVLERNDIDAKLAKSETLKPEFVKKTEIGATMSLRQKKKLAKATRSKTAGKGWDFMAAPEMTPELQRDIDLLKMRGILDPKQRFKSTHLKHTPKYFQMGTMKDDPLHFYSARINKKDRKNTFAEQIMNDQEVVSYQKRKYTQLLSQRENNRRMNKKRKTGADYITV